MVIWGEYFSGTDYSHLQKPISLNEVNEAYLSDECKGFEPVWYEDDSPEVPGDILLWHWHYFPGPLRLCVYVWLWWKAITDSLVLFQWFGNGTQLTPFTSNQAPPTHALGVDLFPCLYSNLFLTSSVVVKMQWRTFKGFKTVITWFDHPCGSPAYVVFARVLVCSAGFWTVA